MIQNIIQRNLDRLAPLRIVQRDRVHTFVRRDRGRARDAVFPPVQRHAGRQGGRHLED